MNKIQEEQETQIFVKYDMLKSSHWLTFGANQC